MTVARLLSSTSTTKSAVAWLNARLSLRVHGMSAPGSPARTITSAAGCVLSRRVRMTPARVSAKRWLGVPSETPSTSESISRPSSTGSPVKVFRPPTAGMAPKSITSGESLVYSKRTAGRSLALLVANASPLVMVTVPVLAGTVTFRLAAAGAAVPSSYPISRRCSITLRLVRAVPRKLSLATRSW
ncbi:hypothetical protein [Kutzneria chonburiensis]|uniref:hypothetical protein n=1 Tax=Kutzneria chonburiensis TaxID=1483604 RepID=UPI00235DE632|nr:hypothetical protein [Kutzneria chonburiensis]